MKVQEKVGNLRNRTGNRVPMTVAPGTINSPLSLVVQASETSSIEGKLTSHRLRESGMVRGSLEILQAVS